MLTAAAVLLLGLIALLAVPLDVRLRINTAGEPHARIGVYWLFGLLGGTLRPGRGGRAPRRKERPGVRKKARKARRPRAMGVFLSLWHSRGFRRGLVRLGRRLLRAIRVRRLQLKVGLDDPADMGRLWGLIGVVTVGRAMRRHPNVRITPDFSGESSFVDCRAHVRVVPVQIIFILMAFLVSPATLKAMGRAAFIAGRK